MSPWRIYQLGRFGNRLEHVYTDKHNLVTEQMHTPPYDFVRSLNEHLQPGMGCNPVWVSIPIYTFHIIEPPQIMVAFLTHY